MSQSTTTYRPQFTRRVTLPNRAALRLGIVLIRWARRPLKIETREQLARRNELHRARHSRESAAENWVLQHVVRR